MSSATTLTIPGLRFFEQQTSQALIGERPAKTADQEHAWLSAGSALVGDASRESAFEEIISRIKGYSRLTGGWDSYGGLPPSEQAVRYSTEVLQQVKGIVEIPPPQVNPISTGVFIEWRKDSENLYFEVDEDSVLFVHADKNVVLASDEDTAFDSWKARSLIMEFFLMQEDGGESVVRLP